ncbi:GtrA family protein, partial [Streptomyces sp. tea 10]|nr:GtrA family protein [Streptomyces sp. tea 10]
MRFLTVGGICYLTTIGINVLLKWAVLEEKPTTALLIATTIASVVSCSPNKRWTFSSRGSRHPEVEAVVSSTGSVRSFLWTRATRSGAAASSTPASSARAASPP